MIRVDRQGSGSFRPGSYYKSNIEGIDTDDGKGIRTILSTTAVYAFIWKKEEAMKKNIVMLAVLLLAAISAQAAQYKFLDKDYHHKIWYYRWLMPDQPDNWISPDNYGQGVAYFRLQVTSFDKTSGDCPKIILQPCFFQDKHTSDKHSCWSRQNNTFTFMKAETKYIKKDMISQWQYGVIDYSRKLLSIMLIDNGCGKKTPCLCGAKVKAEGIVVAKGDKFIAPSHWQCPADWECAGSVRVAQSNPAVSSQSARTFAVSHATRGIFVTAHVAGELRFIDMHGKILSSIKIDSEQTISFKPRNKAVIVCMFVSAGGVQSMKTISGY